MKQGKLVLIVDDSDDSRAILVELLTPAGYRTAEASDGIAGVERAAELRPDLVLMDLSLPRLDGLEATRRIRAAGTSGPIIVITAHAHAEVVKSALEAGCHSVVTKPIPFERLLRTIDGLLSKKP